MDCSKCGFHEENADSKFCSKCANPLSAPEEVQLVNIVPEGVPPQDSGEEHVEALPVDMERVHKPESFNMPDTDDVKSCSKNFMLFLLCLAIFILIFGPSVSMLAAGTYFSKNSAEHASTVEVVHCTTTYQRGVNNKCMKDLSLVTIYTAPNATYLTTTVADCMSACKVEHEVGNCNIYKHDVLNGCALFANEKCRISAATDQEIRLGTTVGECGFTSPAQECKRIANHILAFASIMLISILSLCCVFMMTKNDAATSAACIGLITAVALHASLVATMLKVTQTENLFVDDGEYCGRFWYWSNVFCIFMATIMGIVDCLLLGICKNNN